MWWLQMGFMGQFGAIYIYTKCFGFFLYWLYVSELQCDVICLSPIQAYGQFAGLWISL